VANEPAIRDEAYWQEQAEEAELLAAFMSTPEAKVEMLKIAFAYARLARRARHRRQTRPAHDDLASRTKPAAEES
jgi:hypothetical protein